MKPFILIAGVVAMLFTTIPLVAADREHEQLMADIRMLQEHSLRLHIMLTAVNETLQELSAKIDIQEDATRKGFADQHLSIDNIATGVRVMREKLDETNVRVASLAQEVEALQLAIPRMPPPITQLLTDPETGLPIESLEPPPPAAATRAAGISPQRMYDTAWADYTNGQWALAIQGFEAYVKTFPDSELTDDAGFYVGQTHFAEGNFPEAIEALEAVLLNYPDGDIVPEASYKRGLALDRLGELDRARQAFELVVQNYPDSTMATLAQQALDRLDQPPR